MAKQEKNNNPVEILHLITPTGGVRFGVQNTRTGFVQVVRKLETARKIESHWVSRAVGAAS